MVKVPVRQTIAESYSFVFSRYLPLLGVVWLPLLVMGVVLYFALLPFLEQLPSIMAAQGQDPRASAMLMLGMLPRILLADLIGLLLLAMFSVGITREALGMRDSPKFVYLSFGTAELRVIGGYLLIFLMIVAFSFVLGIVFGIIGAIFIAWIASGGQGDTSESVAILSAFVPMLSLMIDLVMLYFLVRLTTFLTVVSVAENRFGLWRSWALTKGNFWRLLAIILAIWVPLFVAEWILTAIAFGPVFASVIAAVPAGPQAVAAAMAGVMSQLITYLPYIWLALLPAAPVLYGLMIAPAAFAYRALVPAVGGRAAVFR